MFTVKKKVIGNLTKCYSVARIMDQGTPRLLCAAEKQDPCYLFETDGTKVDTLWEGPGGVMTLEQFVSPAVEETVVLATYKFYSPNDSAGAKIMYYTRKPEGGWQENVLCDLPFVHRFGILPKNGRNYLVACTLKSAHAFKDDWTCPGRIWVAQLPEDIRTLNADNQLVLTPLVSGLFRNHGFTKVITEEETFCVVGTHSGVYRVTPPDAEGGEWTAELLMEGEISDILYEDFDGDGERELLTFAPFHGENLAIWKKTGAGFESVWSYPEPMPFLHAICHAVVGEKRVAFLGNREGKKELLALYYDPDRKTYVYEVLDEGAGPANVLYFEENRDSRLLAANRETNEIALYELKVTE